MFYSRAFFRLTVPSVALLLGVVITHAQAPPVPPPGSPQAPAGRGGTQPVTGRGGGDQGGGRSGSPASQRPPQTVTPQKYPPAQVDAGRVAFASQCGFCHGRDAMGGETGADLTRSALVAEDVRGDKIGPVIRSGRPEKGMPPFNLPDTDVAAMVAFIHDTKVKAESLVGSRRTVDVEDLQTGNAQAGQQFFNGAGGCIKCHSPARDFAGLATRLQGRPLMQRMLYPGGREGGSPTLPTATITLASNETVMGKVVYQDEFSIAITDADGWYRSWPTNQVKVSVDNPLEAHIAMLPKYTNADLHDVLAYLQTLK
ncbi:MAG: cytochrome c [Acidobacteriota bacterium]|nr:cytochrome c [Acidobacteriota bacterium]